MQIFIKTVTGKTIAMDVEDGDTIVQSHDPIIRRNESVQIFVQTLTGKTITMDVNNGDTIDMTKIQPERDEYGITIGSYTACVDSDDEDSESDNSDNDKPKIQDKDGESVPDKTDVLGYRFIRTRADIEDSYETKLTDESWEELKNYLDKADFIDYHIDEVIAEFFENRPWIQGNEDSPVSDAIDNVKTNIHNKYLLKNVMWWWHGACDIATSSEAEDEDQKATQAMLNPNHGMEGFIGGRGIVKKHMTKQEKMRSLQMRSLDTVSKDKDLNIQLEMPSCVAPHGLNTVLQPMLEKLEAAKGKHSKDLFAHIFAKISDDKLEQLEEIANPKNRMKTEDKLTQFAYIMLDDLTSLENANIHVNYTRGLIISHFFKAYGEEFYTERNGVESYDNSKFYSEVQGIVKYRLGLKAGTRSEAPLPEAVEEDSRCTVA